MRKKTSVTLSLLLLFACFGLTAQSDPFAPEEERENQPEKPKRQAPAETVTAPAENRTLPPSRAWNDSAAIRDSLSALIRPEDIQQHLQILASDEMEGRETGEEGQRKAAEYIAGQFKAAGLQPGAGDGYLQETPFTFNQWTDIGLHVKGEKYRYMGDYYAFPRTNASLPDTLETEEVIFLGYGIDDDRYSDYRGVDVAGKVIMVYQKEPLNRDSISYITRARRYSDWTLDWRKKLETAKRYGVKAVIFIEPDVNARVSRYRDRLIRGQMSMGDYFKEADNFANSLYVSPKVAKAIIGKKQYRKFIKTRNRIRKKGKPYNLKLDTRLKLAMVKEEKFMLGHNVLGFVEGNDPALKDEIVLVSAHYDHLGKRGPSIYNGADDNGSGSSTVLDIASAMAQAQEKGWGPRRSLLFLLVSGEEKGLLGSQYYVENPLYPLSKTIVDVNVDMIGRVDKNHQDNPYYVYVIGADRLSTELHDINEAMNERFTQLSLDYTYNEKDDPNRFYERSDHYNFAKQGIPAIFYFSGTHADYHQTTDTAEKINYEKTARIGQLILHTVWQLANQDKTIEVDVKE